MEDEDGQATMMGDDNSSVASRMMTQQTAGIGGIDDSTMEEIVDKLKLLDYETQFPQFRIFRPLSRVYFSRPSANPNEQFYCFTSLVSWLMGLCGNHFQAPNQFDDPNVSSANIVKECGRMDLPCKDVAPGKLRPGHGDSVLHVLNSLLDKVLVSQGFNFKPTEYPADHYEEEVDVDDGGMADEVADEANSESDVEEEWYEGGKIAGGDTYGGGDISTSVIETAVSPEEWRLELERVAPLLKLSRRADHKDWRSHLDWISSLLKTIDKMFPDVKTQLEKIVDDITKGIEKIQRREQSLAIQFEGTVSQFRTQKKEHLTLLENLKTNSESVNSLSTELATISDMLEKAKADISQREGKMTDTSPLVRIKDSMLRVKAEVRSMELRLGVLQHTLLHHKVHSQQANATGAAGASGGKDGNTISPAQTATSTTSTLGSKRAVDD